MARLIFIVFALMVMSCVRDNDTSAIKAICIYEDEKWLSLSTGGRPLQDVLSGKYHKLDFREGLLCVQGREEKWGYINQKGNFVIAPQFDWAEGFDKGVARVSQHGRSSHIDKNGQTSSYGHLKTAKEILATKDIPSFVVFLERLDYAKSGLKSIPNDSDYAAEKKELIAQIEKRIIETRKAIAQIEKHIIETQKALETANLNKYIQDRKKFARKAEVSLLDQGIDAHVWAEGKQNSVLRITHVFVNRPFVHKMTTDESFMDKARSMGFKKIVFSDGYDSTWNIPLTQ